MMKIRSWLSKMNAQNTTESDSNNNNKPLSTKLATSDDYYFINSSGEHQNKGKGECLESSNGSICINYYDHSQYKNFTAKSSDISFRMLSQFDTKIPSSREKILKRGEKYPSYGTNVNGESREFSRDNPDPEEPSSVKIADIIGSFGLFQFLVLLFSGLREASVGYDAVVMSIILQPETNFFCADNLHLINTTVLYNDTTGYNATNLEDKFYLVTLEKGAGDFNETDQCYQKSAPLNGELILDELTGEPKPCTNWVFAPSPRASLVAEWDLVCSKHWLIALIESLYFLGLVTGNLIWGYVADRFGRRKAYLISHLIALVAGWLSVVVPSIEFFALFRFLSAFGLIGYNIIYSIQVELIGTKHRSLSTTMNHLGWGLGVVCVPVVDHIFSNYRFIIGVCPMVTLIMFPLAFLLPESSRWLIANGDCSRARQELIRAAKFNGKSLSPALEKKILLLQQKITFDKRKQESIDIDIKPYQLLFRNSILVRDTILLAFVSFTGHLFYYMLTINFAYMKNLSTEANFLISGAGEWVSVVIGAILLRIFSRKTCMSIFLFILCASFIFQSIVDSGLAPSLDTKYIITVNNGIGTLSALLLVFVTLIVNQEVYPTVIRQTGSSIVNTLGESGSTLAPLLIQLGHRFVGIWRMDMFYGIVCFVGMFSIQFVTKTDDIELVDT